jgi:hypothetical protein
MAQQTRLRGNATIEEFPEAVFSTQFDARQTVREKRNTSHYATHINKATPGRGVFSAVRPEAL